MQVAVRRGDGCRQVGRDPGTLSTPGTWTVTPGQPCFRTPMRAIIVSHAYVPPSHRGKLHALTTLGCSVAVAVPARWADPRSGAVVETGWDDDGGVRVVPIPVRGDPSDPADVRWDGRALRRLLKDFRPDIVQVEEEPWSTAAARAVAEARRLRIPSVVYTWLSLPRAHTLAQRLRRRGVYHTVAGAVAGNELAAALLARVRPGLRCAVIPQLGVSPAPAANDLSGPLAIGFIGRLVPEKGLDLLFRACVKVMGDWSLDVVGTGPAQIELEALAERLGISARITWHGALPRTELADVWRTLNCVVLPSRTTRDWVETQGSAAIEAMAHGVPVIVSDTGVLKQVVGEGGLVFPQDDADALASQLRRLLDDPAERARIGADGRRRVISSFSSEALARRQMEFWRRLAEQPASH